MMQIQPPTVLAYHADVTEIVEKNINAQWVNRCVDVIHTLCVDKIAGVDIPFINSMEILVKYSDLCANNLSCRLCYFFRVRTPTQRNDVLPGRHWVWDVLK